MEQNAHRPGFRWCKRGHWPANICSFGWRTLFRWLPAPSRSFAVSKELWFVFMRSHTISDQTVDMYWVCMHIYMYTHNTHICSFDWSSQSHIHSWLDGIMTWNYLELYGMIRHVPGVSLSIEKVMCICNMCSTYIIYSICSVMIWYDMVWYYYIDVSIWYDMIWYDMMIISFHLF